MGGDDNHRINKAVHHEQEHDFYLRDGSRCDREEAEEDCEETTVIVTSRLAESECRAPIQRGLPASDLVP
jgi:hypothetical protein